MHFGENQLSPCSVGISPLSTAPPPVLQHWWVRASTACQGRFTLAMESSHGFGSHPRNARLLETRLPCGSSPLTEINLLRGCTRRIILQKARHQPLVAQRHSGLWLLVSTRFQGLFHPPVGVLFTFPSRYWFTIGRFWSLALESGLPRFPQDCTCLVVLRMPAHISSVPLQDSHLLRSRFPTRSNAALMLVAGPTTPPTLTSQWFGLFPVRSPLLRESHVDFFWSGY